MYIVVFLLTYSLFCIFNFGMVTSLNDIHNVMVQGFSYLITFFLGGIQHVSFSSLLKQQMHARLCIYAAHLFLFLRLHTNIL